MRDVVIVDSVRTGLAKSFRGTFNLTRPDDMVAHCIDALLDRNSQIDPAEVEDVSSALQAKQANKAVTSLDWQSSCQDCPSLQQEAPFHALAQAGLTRLLSLQTKLRAAAQTS